MIIEEVWSSTLFSPAVVLYASGPLIREIYHLATLEAAYNRPVTLGLLEPVFIGRVFLDGLYYVSYLSNQRLSPTDKKVHRSSTTHTVRLSLDNIGIQEIEFLGQGEVSVTKQQNSNSKTRLWYKMIQVPDNSAITEIRSVSDAGYPFLFVLCCMLTLSRISFFETLTCFLNPCPTLGLSKSLNGTPLTRQYSIQCDAIIPPVPKNPIILCE